MKRQFVSTCYLVHERKFLLHFHKKHAKWLPPGGHLEENETPQEAAKREVYEETGLEIAFIHRENLWYEKENARSIERPFSCLLEQIPAHKGEPAHEHIDFIFVAEPIRGSLTHGRWFTLDEIMGMVPHEEIFLDTQMITQTIADQFMLAR